MATAVAANDAERTGAHPRAGSLFIAGVLVTGSMFMGGLLLDGWAHNHLDLSHEGFFTPYHAVFYAGYLALVSVILTQTWANRRAFGLSWREAIPFGFENMLIGLGVFFVGGFCDMLWHIRFGIEQDTEALFSPTHLLLATGGAMVICGAAQAGLPKARSGTWGGAIGSLLPLAFMVTLAGFFLMWVFSPEAGAAADPKIHYGPMRSPDVAEDLKEMQVAAGMAAVVVRSLLMTGACFWAARRIVLPRGAIAFLTVVPTVLVAVQLVPTLLFVGVNAAAALVAGIAGEIVLARFRRIDSFPGSRVFGFVLPCAFWSAYMALSGIADHGFWWTPHVIYGAPVAAGMCGFLLALVTETRAEPSTERHL